MPCIISIEMRSGWLLRYEKTFAKEIVTYEKSKEHNYISFLRFCFSLTIIFGISFCWKFHANIKIAYNNYLLQIPLKLMQKDLKNQIRFFFQNHFKVS
jgi:hypothetical protein